MMSSIITTQEGSNIQIEQISTLISKKNSKILVLKTQLAQAYQGINNALGALDSLLTENTHLKDGNVDLKKKVVDLTHQMIDELVDVEAENSNWSNKFFYLEEKFNLLSYDNNILNEKLKVVSQTGHKGKVNRCDLQFELKSKLNLTTLLERDGELVRDLV